MIKKLNIPNNTFTHAELVSMYENGDIAFNCVRIDEHGNIIDKQSNLVAEFGKYPFHITDEEYFNLKFKK